MPISRSIAAPLTAVLLAGLLAAPEARAQVDPIKILLLSFKGPTGKNTRNRLVKEFSGRDEVKLVPRKKALVEGKKLGIPADSKNPSHLSKLGEKMGYDATVMAEITAIEDGPRSLELTILLTLDPDHPRTFTFTWESKLAPQDEIESMADIITATVGASIQSEEVITPYVEEVEEEEEFEFEHEPPPPEKEKKDWTQGQILFIHAGVGLGARKLTVETDPPPNIQYDGGAFAAIDAQLRFYPARIATTHPAAGIGLGVGFTRSLGLSSSTSGASGEYDTAFTKLDIDLLYEFPLGRTPLWLSFSVGWGLLHYTIDTGPTGMLAVPSYQYKNVILGTNLRIVAVDPYLTVEVGGDVRIIHDVGDAENAYGATARGVGGSAWLALTGEIIKGFSWSAGFTYTGMGTSFQGDCTNPVNCTLAVASSSTDHYPMGWIRLGYTW